MTVRDFLDMCTQDYVVFNLFDCDGEDSFTGNVMDGNLFYGADGNCDDDLEEALDCECMSWDIDDGIICFNYTKE